MPVSLVTPSTRPATSSPNASRTSSSDAVVSSTVSCSSAAHSVSVSSRMPAQIFATPTGWTMKSSPDWRRWSAWCSQAKTKACDDPRAVDRLGDLVGVLLDDREQVGEQLALERRQVGRDVGVAGVRVRRGRRRRRDVVDRPPAGAAAVTVRRSAIAAPPSGAAAAARVPASAIGAPALAAPRSSRVAPRPLSGRQAACRWVSLLRYRSPSSSLRW